MPSVSRINQATPFLEGIPNSQVSREWYRLLVSISTILGGGQNVPVLPDIIAEIDTARKPDRSALDRATLNERITLLESQVQRLTGALIRQMMARDDELESRDISRRSGYDALNARVNDLEAMIIRSRTASSAIAMDAPFALGGVLFGDGGGTPQVDGNNLFWDNVNKRIGIGTNSPTYRFVLNGTDFSYTSGYSNTKLAQDSLGLTSLIIQNIPYLQQFDNFNDTGGSFFALGAGTIGAGNNFLKSRSTNGSTPVAVQNGDQVGAFWFGGDSGVNAAGNAGSIYCGTNPFSAYTTPLISVDVDGTVTGTNVPLSTSIRDTAGNKVLKIGPAANQLVPGTDGNVSLGDSTHHFKRLYLDYTNTATVGNVTINKASGRVNIAAAGTSMVLTNSLITAASKVICNVATNDGTAKSANAVPAAGSATIYLNAAATGQVAIDFVVVNSD